MDEVTIYIRSKRVKRAERAQMLQHGLAGFTLLMDGVERVQRHLSLESLSLGLVDLLVCAALVLIIRRELRGSKPSEHGTKHSLGWVDITAAVLLMTEVFQRVYESHKFSRPNFIVAVITLLAGLFHGRIEQFKSQRRFVRLNEQGIDARFSPVRRLKVLWSEILSVRFEESLIRFEGKDGFQKDIKLRDFENASEVTRAVKEWTEQRILLAGPKQVAEP